MYLQHELFSDPANLEPPNGSAHIMCQKILNRIDELAELNKVQYTVEQRQLVFKQELRILFKTCKNIKNQIAEVLYTMQDYSDYSVLFMNSIRADFGLIMSRVKMIGILYAPFFLQTIQMCFVKTVKNC